MTQGNRSDGEVATRGATILLLDRQQALVVAFDGLIAFAGAGFDLRDIQKMIREYLTGYRHTPRLSHGDER